MSVRNYFADQTAIIDEGAKIGNGVKIWHWVHVSSGAKIGHNTSIGQGCYIGNNVRIGSGCKIQNNVSVYDNVHLDDDVFCGPSMVFTNVYNPRSQVNRKQEYRDTLVERGVTFGANCTIVCGVNIGEYAFIGAGALINRDVKPFALMIGVPARQIGWMSAFGKRLDLPLDGYAHTVCEDTNSVYKLIGGRIVWER